MRGASQSRGRSPADPCLELELGRVHLGLCPAWQSAYWVMGPIDAPCSAHVASQPESLVDRFQCLSVHSLKKENAPSILMGVHPSPSASPPGRSAPSGQGVPRGVQVESCSHTASQRGGGCGLCLGPQEVPRLTHAGCCLSIFCFPSLCGLGFRVSCLPR
uniref:Uncharacterized protein n=1 Tax=Myotis myotis TaxID=51298 RepID=A0A7J7VIB5_MYOMY|nr:hypothetical protein mMyoMyo1_008225 [Myotis myotis]